MTAAEQINGRVHRPLPVAVTQSLAVAVIDESPTNPRKTFLELDELAADIKVHGVLQDVLVRPHPRRTGRYELVFGARRFRATKLAGLKEIPAKVRDLDDAKVLELQIVENSQRSDIHPIEEADGYQMLHEKHGFSVADIAAKVGKPTSTIYARLKLCALVPEARKAVFDNVLSIGAALVIARIPHADLQKQALTKLTAHRYGDDGPISAQQASNEVKRSFMLRLAEAPFERGDATLVDGVPSCNDCPKRTGNQRELFADVEAKDDLCTDTKCFDGKRDAAWKKKVAAAKESGQTVLSSKEVKTIFPQSSSFVSSASGYVDLGGTTWDGEKQKTNRQLLGKADVPVVLARDPNGGIHELVAAKDFNKVARAEKKATKPAKRDAALDAELEADRKKREREKKKAEAVIADLGAKAERRQPTDAFWRTLAIAVAREADFTTEEVFERRGIVLEGHPSTDREELVTALVSTLTGPQARGFAVEVLATSTMSCKNATDFQALYGPAAKPVATAKKRPKQIAKTKTATKKKGKARR